MSKKEAPGSTPTEFEQQRQKALKTSISEGSAASFSTGISNAYIIPFALKLTQSSTNIGILSSFSALSSPLAQIWGSKLMEKHPRKKIVLIAVLIQALLWIPIALLAWLAYKNIFPFALIYALIIIYTLLTAFGGLANPPWFSWMGDLVPEKTRGKYFAKRNLIAGIVELSAALIAVFILQAFENKALAILGFGILFLLAFLFRLFSFELLRIQYVPHLRPRKSYRIKLKEFLSNNSNFRRFALYQLFFNIAIMFASPFFAVYMLQDLKFSYPTYIAVSISSTIFYLLFTPLMGRLSDRYGNKRLLIIANIAFVLSPFSWLFIKNPFYIIIVPQLVAGIANAALVLGLSNFSLDSLDEKARGTGIAYLNLMVGIGTFIGSILGGLVLDYLTISFMNRFLFVFAAASCLRLLVALIFLPKIQEVRRVPQIKALSTIVHSTRTFHTEAKHFVLHLQEKEAEGLKVWASYPKNVLWKKT